MSVSPAADSPQHDVRVDPHLGVTVHVVGHRQTRPNLPDNAPIESCPFCPGGLEAPVDYEVRWFPNRWPAMPDRRCEVVLYSSDHHATVPSLGETHMAKVVDLWADRTRELGSRDDVAFVLVFENRGASVGATISHPHGQIYAYDHVPDRPRRMFASGWTPSDSPARLVCESKAWTASVPWAPVFPTAVVLAPRRRVGDLPSLEPHERIELAAMLGEVLDRLDRLYGEPLPYMMWINQRPTDGSLGDAWLNVEIVSPWRGPGLPRYIAAAEVGTGEYFNPVDPDELASRLRALGS